MRFLDCLFLSIPIVGYSQDNDVVRHPALQIKDAVVAERDETKNAIPFLILYHGSQGSTWFVQEFSEYEGICMVGNELIDRVDDPNNRISFIENAASSFPTNFQTMIEWKHKLFNLASQSPSVYDIKIFGKCNGLELAYGYKARLSPGEIKFVLSPLTQNSLRIKVIVVSRNPVKQALSEYRRNNEKHDQRHINDLIHEVKRFCGDNLSVSNEMDINSECKERVTKLEEAKNFKSYVQPDQFKDILDRTLNYYVETKAILDSIEPTLPFGKDATLLDITYEEMLKGMGTLIHYKIFPFFGIDKDSPEANKDPSTFVLRDFFDTKATQDLMCEAVQNYNDFCADMKRMYGSGDAVAVGPMSHTVMGFFDVDACGAAVDTTAAEAARTTGVDGGPSTDSQAARRLSCCPRCME